MERLRALWGDVKESLWFVPATIVAAAIVLAFALVEIDAYVSDDLLARWPRLFGAGAEGSRGMLSAIASSMITVAGVTFSITIAALAQASSQYTPRVLRTFMGDRSNQVVLGVFVGVFAYCLVVLRTIRGGEERVFVPSLAVVAGVVLALVGVGFLIFFIHHIATALQASSIIASVALETEAAIDRLFPDALGADPSDERHTEGAPDGGTWRAVPAPASGYVQRVDDAGLLRAAREHDLVVRMEQGVGDFVAEGAPLVSVRAADAARASVDGALATLFRISRFRTIELDAGFGVQQIVDIALKALSPGVNDTTTAATCVDYLSALLGRLAGRRIPSAERVDGGRLRVLAKGPTFESLVDLAIEPIRRNAERNVTVLARMVDAIETISRFATDAGRRRTLARHLELIEEAASRALEAAHDRSLVLDRAARVATLLREEGA